MDNKEIIKQMIDFHKTTFENCFSMMTNDDPGSGTVGETFEDFC